MLPLDYLLKHESPWSINHYLHKTRLDDDLFFEFIHDSYADFSYDFPLLATVFLTCDKTHIIIDMLNQRDQIPNQRLWLISVLKGFFDVNIFLYLEEFEPQYHAKLKAFQNNNFSPDLISPKPFTFHTFNQGFFKLGNRPKQINIMIRIFDFLNLIHPCEFDFMIDEYNSVFSEILFQLLGCTSLFSIKRLENKFLATYNKLNDDSKHLAYTHLCEIYKQTILLERNIPLFSSLFDNPVFCSLAFKEQHPKFLRFCNPSDFITDNPEYFAI